MNLGDEARRCDGSSFELAGNTATLPPEARETECNLQQCLRCRDDNYNTSVLKISVILFTHYRQDDVSPLGHGHLKEMGWLISQDPS